MVGRRKCLPGDVISITYADEKRKMKARRQFNRLPENDKYPRADQPKRAKAEAFRRMERINLAIDVDNASIPKGPSAAAGWLRASQEQ